MSSTNLAWNDVIDVHLTFICATDSTASTITIEHTLALCAVASAVQLI
jgi:hypothetical protein